MSDSKLERLIREDLAEHEGLRHEHRMIMIGVGSILLGFLSSRYMRQRREKILRGELYNDKVRGLLEERGR